MIHNQPYAELAKIYDRVMEHVNYEEWSRYLSSVFEHFKVPVTSILETACGTGSLSIHLHRMGFDVTGMDLSSEMLAVAAKKFRNDSMPLKLFASDMTLIPLDAVYDAVLCLYDSINYLLTPDEINAALGEAYRVTRRGGLFIFDVCTVKNSEMFFSNHSLFEDFGDVTYRRTCFYYDYSRIQENHFIIEHNGEQYAEKHLQKIYKIEEIDDMIAQSHFTKGGVFNDMSFAEGSEDSERVHFVLVKR